MKNAYLCKVKHNFTEIKRFFYAALLLSLAIACGKSNPGTDPGNNNNNNNGNEPGGGGQERTEWTLTYVVALPVETAKYMDVEITHKDASGKEVSDGDLTSESTSDGWPSADLSKLLTTEAPKRNWPDGVASQNLILKVINVGKVKANYADFENVLVAKIKLHNDIPDNIKTPTLMPFSIYSHEDRNYLGSTTLYTENNKSPDLKTFLTMEAASGKKITDRNWGFDYISLD